MKRFRAALVLAFLFLPTEARVSQIFFRDISLEDVQVDASVILRAKYKKTPEEEKNGGMAFDVEYAWKGGDQSSREGKRIRVWQKSAEAWGRVHDIAERTGMRESPIVSSYRNEEKREPVEGKPYLLFLGAGVREGEYVFVAQNSFEEPEKVPTRFNARVTLVEPLLEGKSVPVDPDPRFFLRLDELVLFGQGNAPVNKVFGIHSPAKTLQTTPEKAKGKTFHFLLWKTDSPKPSYRLEAGPAKSGRIPSE